MAVQKIGVGLIGVGGIAQNRLLPEGIGRSRFCHFIGACDPKISAVGRAAVAKFGGRVFATQEEMLARTDISMVVIASPHHLHFEQAHAVLNAGKHAWVEKPLATRFDEAKELARIARVLNHGLVVDSMMRQNALNIYAAHQIASGLIGQIIRVETNMEFYYTDFSGFRYQEKDQDGGGPAWDVMPHCVYMAMFLTGTNTLRFLSSVIGPKLHPESIPHQSFYMNYLLDGQIHAHSSTSFVTAMPNFDMLLFRVYGTNGIIEGYGTMFQHSDTVIINPNFMNDQRLVIRQGTDPDREVITVVKPRDLRAKGLPVNNIYEQEIDRLARPIAERGTLPVDENAMFVTSLIETGLVTAINIR